MTTRNKSTGWNFLRKWWQFKNAQYGNSAFLDISIYNSNI